MEGMNSPREQAAASALGSVRAEGGEPGQQVEALLPAWGRGEVGTDRRGPWTSANLCQPGWFGWMLTTGARTSSGT